MNVYDFLIKHPNKFVCESQDLERAKSVPLTRPVGLESATKSAVVLVSKPADLALALEKKVQVIFACHPLRPETSTRSFSDVLLLKSPALSETLRLVLAEHNPKVDWSQGTWASGPTLPFELHPSAIVSKQAVIGAGAVIGPGCVIEPFAQIGAETHLRAQVFVGAHCVIGDRVLIAAGTVIGSDGFGYHRTPQKTFEKIPQIGIVRIEDDVEIGSNCSIDRATLTETVIKKGTKLDNLIHIAHNSVIGEHCALAGGFMCAGSIQIGNYCRTGGSVVVSDHIQIADDVDLGGRTAVTQDIATKGTYLGHPAQPLSTALKIQALLTQLPDMRKQLLKLQEKVFGQKE